MQWHVLSDCGGAAQIEDLLRNSVLTFRRFSVTARGHAHACVRAYVHRYKRVCENECKLECMHVCAVGRVVPWCAMECHGVPCHAVLCRAVSCIAMPLSVIVCLYEIACGAFCYV